VEKYRDFIIGERLGTIIDNGLFSNITTLRVGGKIDVLFYPNTYDNFVKFYRFYLKNKTDKNQPKLFIIGNGSNVLANDSDYKGIVVCFKYIKKDIEVCYSDEECVVNVYAGTSLVSLSNFLINNNLSGAEFIHFIPGLVGGAVAMNASCYGTEMSDVIKRVLCVDKKGIVKWYNKEDLNFTYRNSLIKNEDLIVIKVELVLKKEVDNKLILDKINEFRKNRILSQPIGYLSAGSVFKNKNNKCAWKIVEELGFKGYTLGGCKVSNKHSNFIVNNGNAKARDIYKLMNKIKKEYNKKYDDELECEWILINFDE